MKITIEIPDQHIYDCLNAANRSYSPWAKVMRLNKNMTGKILESKLESGEDSDKSHNIDVKAGLKRLAKYSPLRFANLMRGETDAVDADVFLQLCAGLMHNDGPKYG
jgi:hypothetical protein